MRWHVWEPKSEELFKEDSEWVMPDEEVRVRPPVAHVPCDSSMCVLAL
jgi:hypothetical protein